MFVSNFGRAESSSPFPTFRGKWRGNKEKQDQEDQEEDVTLLCQPSLRFDPLFVKEFDLMCDRHVSSSLGVPKKEVRETVKLILFNSRGGQLVRISNRCLFVGGQEQFVIFTRASKIHHLPPFPFCVCVCDLIPSAREKEEEEKRKTTKKKVYRV